MAFIQGNRRQYQMLPPSIAEESRLPLREVYARLQALAAGWDKGGDG